MDYFAIMKENNELKEKLKNVQEKKEIRSSVVEAYKESESYKFIENEAFLNFLKYKFANEFESSNFAKKLITLAQKEFEDFEKNYNKGVEKNNGRNAKSNNRTAKTSDGVNTED